MLKEVIIVEGKMDTVAVKRALECDTIETGGFALRPQTLKQIEAAYKKRGIIILTDPDGSGERIRKFLTERFPDAGQAFVPKKDARVPGNRCLTWQTCGTTGCPAARRPAVNGTCWGRN